MKRDGVLIASQNHKVIYEDELIRVLSETVPGASEEPYHLHPYWSVAVNVAAVPATVINRDASGKSAEHWYFADVLTDPLFVAVSPPAAMHSIKNIGTTADRVIRVEFKAGAVPRLLRPAWLPGKMPLSEDGSDPRGFDASQDGPVAARANHRVLFDDADIRVQHVTIPAHSEEPYHLHANPAVLIAYLSPREITMRATGGKVMSAPQTQIPIPWVRLTPPQGLHSIKNDGAQPQRLIRIEYKHGFAGGAE